MGSKRKQDDGRTGTESSGGTAPPADGTRAETPAEPHFCRGDVGCRTADGLVRDLPTETILEAFGDAISIQDRSFHVLYQNAAHQRFFGDRRGEYCYNAYERNESVCSGCGLDMAFLDGTSHTVIRTAPVEGRGLVYAEISSSPLRDESGRIVAGIEVARDITHRMQVEQEVRRHLDLEGAVNRILQQSIEDVPLEEILQGTLEKMLSFSWLSIESRGGILVTDDSGDLLMAAQLRLDEAVLRECARIPPGRCLCGQAARDQTLLYASSIDDRHDIRYEGIRPHGHYCVPIVFKGATLGVIVLYLQEGHGRNEHEEQVLRTIANVLAGVIQRKRMEQERQQLITGLQDLVQQVTLAKQEWQDTFDSITDPIYLSDRDLGIVRANKAFYGYFGIDPQDALGKKCYSVLYGLDAAPEGCPHMEVLATGRPQAKEMPSPKGSRMLLVEVFPYSSADGRPQGTICIMRDITEKKEQDRRLAVSERFAGLGQMASGIAHEINNPLSAISGAAEGLQSRVASGRYDPAFFQRYLEIIGEEVLRCKNITTAMLSFVRQSTAERTEVDVHTMIGNILDSLASQETLQGIDIRLAYGADIPVLQGGEGELRQVFTILINNSLDAMEGKGTLTIRTLARDGAVAVQVTDTGPGIPEEFRYRIFDPFFTTKLSTGGTGLGLSIARKIISNHGGSIEAATHADGGATFTVSLPTRP